MRRLLALLVVAAALSASACAPFGVTFVRVSKGNPIQRAGLARIEAGRTRLPELLALLGAPLEVHAHPDGRLLVYRHQQRNTFRVGVQPGQALSAVDLTQVTSEALSNLRLTVETIHSDEDRVVVLLDRAGVVAAVGVRLAADDVPAF